MSVGPCVVTSDRMGVLLLLQISKTTNRKSMNLKESNRWYNNTMRLKSPMYGVSTLNQSSKNINYQKVEIKGINNFSLKPKKNMLTKKLEFKLMTIIQAKKTKTKNKHDL